ncbi:amino acid adenylation domain-containing protein [Paenibacillus sp. RC253]|uniref:amino acid adenylation domain-containing protein n=1 Tax=Paenibacillus sp. RC253 TaxID=3156313 RepID=UPI003850BCD9
MGVAQVGIYDSFLDLGGDSIKSIQVSAELFQAGYQVGMKELLTNPTIAALSSHVEPVKRTAEQGEIRGVTGMTPIQQAFVIEQATDLHHYNQCVVLQRPDGWEVRALQAAMQAITDHHDALRTVLRRSDSGYTAWTRQIGEGAGYSLEVLDMAPDTDSEEAIAAEASRIQATMDLSEGPLVKLGLFRCTDGDHLLVAIHHWVIDGVSWRILLEDLGTAYTQAQQGEPIRLPMKTDAFQAWAEGLSHYARSEALQAEAGYWAGIQATAAPQLPQDYAETGVCLVKNSEEVTVQWTAGETEQLLKQSHRAYTTEMNDLLLTGLGRAIQAWTGITEVALSLEGHGREAIVPELDVTRTVGWLTSRYPVRLSFPAGQALSVQIKTVKEELRRVPNKGIGYGLLRYTSDQTEDGPAGQTPEISFNYLGQYDLKPDGHMRPSPYHGGLTVSERHVRTYLLEIHGMVYEGKLSLTISYSHTQYKKESIEQLGNCLRTSLQEIILHCISKEGTELTPSDVSFSEMEISELDRLIQSTQQLGELESLYPMTPMQKGMLFHSLLDSQSEAYFEQMIIHLEGHLDMDILAQSLNRLGQRHAVFRTSFYSGWNKEALQVVFQKSRIDLVYQDINCIDKSERNDRVFNLAAEDRRRGFDLEQDPLTRFTVLQSGPDEYDLIWSFHHMLMDGWCIPMVTQELFELYDAISQRRPPRLKEVFPYSSYVNWLGAQNQKEASDYWKHYLAGYEGHTSLSSVLPASPVGAPYQAKLAWSLGEDLTTKLKNTAIRQHVTVNTLMQTVWGLLLQRYNNTTDVVFGSVVSGRPPHLPGIQDMIGLFINTVPVRIQCSPDQTFSEIIRIVQQQAVASHSYETFPLYEIQAQTEQKQKLISHIMVFENYPIEQALIQGSDPEATSLQILDVKTSEQTNYDFMISVVPGENMQIEFQYNTETYSHAHVARMKGHLERIITQVTNLPDLVIRKLDILTREESQNILEHFNNTAAVIPEHILIHQFFEAQAARTPERIALVYGEVQMTYAELNAQANRLARTLRKAGVREDHPVAMLFERSPQVILSMLAIWKAGGAYVPIDPEYPASRIEYMLEDSGAAVLLTDYHTQHHINFAGESIIVDHTPCGDEDSHNLVCNCSISNLAYIIYTSGSTGQPKGVAVEHRSVLNFLHTLEQRGPLEPEDVLLQKTSVSFDASVWELCWWMLKGACLSILEPGEEKDPAAITAAVQRYGVSHLEFAPSMLQAFVDYVREYSAADQLATLKYISVGGEMLSSSLARQFYDVLTIPNGSQLYNTYGPTEATVEVASYLCHDQHFENSIPIGTPNLNTRLYILNEFLQPQPIGIAGELYIAGAGVARGYVNQPEATASRFVPDPFQTEPNAKMYRTGDLAVFGPEGYVYCLGRLDDQVKIRGFRIEMGEIENILLKLESVQEAIVLARDDGDGDKVLCAYITAGKHLSTKDVRTAVARYLPAYMVPSYVIQLDRMPWTTSGKINRQALPVPAADQQSAEVYIPPRTHTEQLLAAIWADILKRERVSITDHFFDIGGHSLKATQLVAKIHKELNAKVTLKDIFTYPTIEDMAGYVDRMENRTSYTPIPKAPESVYYPVSSAQKRLFIASQSTGGEMAYNMPAVLIVEGALDVDRLEYSLRQLIQRHEPLRTGFEAIEGEPVQYVHAEAVFDLEQITAGETAVDVIISNFIRPFELHRPPLMRAGIVPLGNSRHLLLFDMHHLISDGISINIFMKEFIELYEGKSMPPLTIQYKDYAVWQQQQLENEEMNKHAKYWLNMFNGDLPKLELPTDYERLPVQSHEGEEFQFEADITVSQGIMNLEKHTGATLHMILLAAYTVLLAKYSGQEDVIVGTPMAGRTHVDTEPLIGMFVNTLAIRNYPSAEKSFLTLLQEVKDTMTSAFEHQSYPFEELVDKLHLKRDISRTPLFDTMLVLQNTEETTLAIESLTFTPYTNAYNTAKFDLTLYATADEQGLRFSFEYGTRLFKAKTMERMSNDLLLILIAISTDPRRKLMDISLSEMDENELGLIEISI